MPVRGQRQRGTHRAGPPATCLEDRIKECFGPNILAAAWSVVGGVQLWDVPSVKDRLEDILTGGDVTMHADHMCQMMCALNATGLRGVLWTRSDPEADTAVQNFLLSKRAVLHVHHSIHDKLLPYAKCAKTVKKTADATCLLFEYQQLLKVYEVALAQCPPVAYVNQAVKVALAADTILLRHQFPPAGEPSVEEMIKRRMLGCIVRSAKLRPVVRERPVPENPGLEVNSEEGEEDCLGTGEVVFQRSVTNTGNRAAHTLLSGLPIKTDPYLKKEPECATSLAPTATTNDGNVSETTDGMDDFSDVVDLSYFDPDINESGERPQKMQRRG